MGESSSSSGEEVSCADGNVMNRIGCILSYGGDVQDTILNYFMILLNLLYCIKILFYCRRNLQEDDKDAHRLHKMCALASLIFVVIFQIGLCLGVACSGVSIIWCSMGGWIMSERRYILEESSTAGGEGNATAATSTDNISSSNRSMVVEGLKYFGKFVIFCDTIVIIYYAVVSERITTVAHICALVLGAILSEITLKLVFRDHRGNGVDAMGSSQRLLSPT